MMRLQILIETLEDITNWRDAFLVLAIERARPLLSTAGVPKSIASAPDSVTQVARLWLTDHERASNSRYPAKMRAQMLPEGYAKAVETLLAEAFARIAKDYGEESTVELHDWLRRHFVDRIERNRWWLLSMLLPRLANAFGAGAPVMACPLEPINSMRFDAAVRLRFSSDSRARDAQLTAQAEAIPLSAAEKQLARLEVIEPDDPDEVDVVLALELVLDQERAFRAWQEVVVELSASERAALGRWVAAEAQAMNVPAQLITDLVEQ